MMRKIILSLFFILAISLPTYSAGADYPLPKDAEQIMSKDTNYGPMKMHLEGYKTSISRERLMAFYRQLLAKDGWNETREMFFKKGNQALIITVAPGTPKFKDGKIMFNVAQSNMPTQEEIMATKKDIPDQVSFMPVYPGAKQLFLFDNPHGASASYNTNDSLKDVMFFYESKMPGYGWALVNETPITEKKLEGKEFKGVNTTGTSRKTELRFKREKESCTIHIYEGKLNQELPEAGEKGADKPPVSGIMYPLGKTQILVTYNDFRKL